jgi:hypothetical protein
VGDKEALRRKMEDIFREKRLFHKERARLPFEEKIKILVQLQQLANDIPRNSKSKEFRRVWEI